MHWSEDENWIGALERYHDMREIGTRTLTLDLGAIEQVIFNDNGPAYQMMSAMRSVLEHEGADGFRGAPRLVLALLMQLSEISTDKRDPEQVG
jgi:hypothetical protein